MLFLNEVKFQAHTRTEAAGIQWHFSQLKRHLRAVELDLAPCHSTRVADLTHTQAALGKQRRQACLGTTAIIFDKTYSKPNIGANDQLFVTCGEQIE